MYHDREDTEESHTFEASMSDQSDSGSEDGASLFTLNSRMTFRSADGGGHVKLQCHPVKSPDSYFCLTNHQRQMACRYLIHLTLTFSNFKAI